MKLRSVVLSGVFGLLVAGGAGAAPQTDEQDPGPEEEIETLTRGPMHEAFATPVVFDPSAGPVAPKPAPPELEELPPDEKPDGDDVVWISGYWSFDEERDGHVWVSGIWRRLPPGRQWVPGYWRPVGSGAQWVSGFWAPLEQQEADYLPAPPRSVEAGPSSAAPSPDHTYVPGTWRWIEGRYIWSPGYWVQTRPEWIWTPAQYVWTPGGYVFVNGYWDYEPEVRGLMFAPVYVRPAAYGVVYTPRVALNVGVVFEHSFCRTAVRSYYFGDYYEARYVTFGYHPAFAYHMSVYGYDPIWAHTVVVRTRAQPNFLISVRARFGERRANVAARPPRTYRNQINIKNVNKTVIKNKNVVNNTTIQNNDNRSFEIGKPIEEVKKGGGKGARKMNKVEPDRRQALRREAGDVNRQAGERRKTERVAEQERKGENASRRQLPRSPLGGDRPRSGGANVAPPQPDRPRPRPETAPLRPGQKVPRPLPRERHGGTDVRRPPEQPAGPRKGGENRKPKKQDGGG